MSWKLIDENTPKDKSILLRHDFAGIKTPCVVVGELMNFKGKTHHLWNGNYQSVVSLFREESQQEWDEKFTYWMELND